MDRKKQVEKPLSGLTNRKRDDPRKLQFEVKKEALQWTSQDTIILDYVCEQVWKPREYRYIGLTKIEPGEFNQTNYNQ